jgi:hypothetical protein
LGFADVLDVLLVMQGAQLRREEEFSLGQRGKLLRLW